MLKNGLMPNDSLAWYTLEDTDQIDSPALIIYRDRVMANIRCLLDGIDDPLRLRPHVKTHKTREVTALLLEAGIRKFKCATIAEAEMLAQCRADDVLLAYQPVGPKLSRFIELIQRYPSTTFACLTDHIFTARAMSKAAVAAGVTLLVYVDLNVGMNRTGITPGAAAMALYQAGTRLPGLRVMGLHAYDGHLRDPDLAVRTQQCDAAFAPVEAMIEELIQAGYAKPIVVAGGSPTFPIHAQRSEVECSPGTFVYWDKGYGDTLTEQPFEPAALLLCRIVSLPTETKLCIDLGHKSVAAEHALTDRVVFLNAPALRAVSQSEEHLVVEAPTGHAHQIGDVLYGLPIHICPTCALYEKAHIIENGTVTGQWRMIARDRELSV